MVIFHSYVSLPEGIFAIKHPGPQQLFLFLPLNQTIINHPKAAESTPRGAGLAHNFRSSNPNKKAGKFQF
jgi:hypothetical protein